MEIEDIARGKDGRTPVQVVMDYIADMNALEIWAFPLLMPPTPGAFEPVKVRAAAIRAKHCTPRAQTVWSGAPSVSGPPDNDPATTVVVEVTATSVGRVRVTTIETNQNLAMTKEYGLVRTGGNWRLNSRAFPRDAEGYPRVIIPL